MDAPSDNSHASPEAPNAPPAVDAYAALRVPRFRRYFTGNLLSLIGMQMQTVAVGWEVYDLTHDTMALAYVGLVQVVPVVMLALVAGQVADRFSRRLVISLSVTVVGLASLGLAANSYYWHDLPTTYGLLFITGVARAFQQPAKASYMPTLVPRELFSNAVTWATSGFQLASVLGPAAAGFLIDASGGAAIVYFLDAVFTLIFVAQLLTIPSSNAPRHIEPFTWQGVIAGAHFLRRNPVVLGAITLDMFAVLLGGAMAMLPVYAEDILLVGPSGLGWLRAAPAVGAILTAMIVAHRPPIEKAGRALLLSVVGFGMATIVFGLSESFYLSMAMMFMIGVTDNISVIVRHTLVQVLTPDAMRGRVSALNGMFISLSNELGDFESGSVAKLVGSPVIAVVSGGIGTLLVVVIAAIVWPDLRRYGRLGSGGRE